MNWKNMPLAHKIAFVISCIAVIVWLIPHIKPNLFPVDPTCPAVAVFTICEAIINWNSRRKFAYLLIIAAVVSMAFFILEMMLL